MENGQLKSFKDLKVWQKSVDLAVLAYSATEKFPRSELYGITNQIRRSAISISSNLAEGFKRNHRKEKMQFYKIAYGSTSELESQIEVSRKLNFLNENDYQCLSCMVIEVGKMLDGLVKSQVNKFPKSYILSSIFFFLLLTSIFYILNPSPLFAAELSIESKTQDVRVGDLFEVNLSLNTDGEKLNAFEGNLFFSDNLELKKIEDGDSIINLWIEHPSVPKSNIQNFISFSGITPGGYKGPKGLIFRVVFTAKKEGEGKVAIEKERVLKNDGLGTEVKISKKNLEFRIENLGGESSINPKSYILNPVKDIVPPEDFKPIISKDNNLYDGKYFLVFNTQDKISGIDRYEIREGFFGKFVVAESPYLLQNQKLNKKIIVKAVDKTGNERMEIIYPQNWIPWYENYWIIGIIVGIMIAGYCGWKKRRKFRKRKYGE